MDRALERLLEDVRLGYLSARWGLGAEGVDWENVLSLGEQQRLGMARLFFHRPKFAVLDECTNAVSVDVERGLYERAAYYGITMLTITQRSGLVDFHKTLVDVRPQKTLAAGHAGRLLERLIYREQ